MAIHKLAKDPWSMPPGRILVLLIDVCSNAPSLHHLSLLVLSCLFPVRKAFFRPHTFRHVLSLYPLPCLAFPSDPSTLLSLFCCSLPFLWIHSRRCGILSPCLPSSSIRQDFSSVCFSIAGRLNLTSRLLRSLCVYPPPPTPSVFSV